MRGVKGGARTLDRYGRPLRLFGGGLSVRVSVRPVVVCAVLAVCSAAVSVVALSLGDYAIPFADVVAALAGEGNGGDRFVVNRLRLPRVVSALLVGAALGASGAVFQSFTRNPLASPDVIGFTTGAATGGIVAIIVLAGGSAAVAAGALVGGGVVSLLVYVISFRRGVQGYRLVLIGIGMSSVLLSVNTYLLTRADFEVAAHAQRWLIGSLNGRSWSDVQTLAVVLAVLLPTAMLLGRALRLLELGDDTAHALGLRVERSRVALLLVAVGMVAVSTSVAGPIAFVALAAPQLAKRLSRAGSEGIAASALMGALLLLVSDVVAQRVIAGVQFPVGILTGIVGGVYLVYLLMAEWWSGRG
ncbi:iron complex transport system permease protein [Sinosporangium album]|uniref:Iron complex transport system permease protein n=1 Tax=Sinosporangium album TaxID=504805 RepID=A0A1G7ZPX2_9ACTN|nr:iron chelate uptake ABC transporter family permease subunit [Sinosporangium album]SDH10744.1 iron complex transport system permease protein [Sinosporangium album]